MVQILYFGLHWLQLYNFTFASDNITFQNRFTRIITQSKNKETWFSASFHASLQPIGCLAGKFSGVFLLIKITNAFHSSQQFSDAPRFPSTRNIIVLLSNRVLRFFATRDLLSRILHLIQENRTKLQAQCANSVTGKRHTHPQLDQNKQAENEITKRH